MGNCKSCIDAVPQTATIIDGHHRLRQIKVLVTAAEIMLDNLGYVIAPEHVIRRTHRVTIMRADEELRSRNIYLMVPSFKANSRISKTEMELLDNVRGSKRRRCKILPTVTARSDGVNRLALEDETGFITSSRVSYSCPWRPVLDPIFEENSSIKENLKANCIGIYSLELA